MPRDHLLGGIDELAHSATVVELADLHLGTLVVPLVRLVERVLVQPVDHRIVVAVGAVVDLDALHDHAMVEVAVLHRDVARAQGRVVEGEHVTHVLRHLIEPRGGHDVALPRHAHTTVVITNDDVLHTVVSLVQVRVERLTLEGHVERADVPHPVEADPVLLEHLLLVGRQRTQTTGRNDDARRKRHLKIG